MAKKYKQSMKDRMAESRGMERYETKKMMKEDHYGQMDSRRRKEYEDSMMIKEDRSQIANLPQQVKMMPWGDYGAYGNYNLDDTIRGIDIQMRDDGKKMKKDEYPEKY